MSTYLQVGERCSLEHCGAPFPRQTSYHTHVKMIDIASVFKSVLRCINEERFGDLSAYCTEPMRLNGGDVSAPEAFGSRIRAAGKVTIEADALTIDAATQRMGALTVVHLQPAPGRADARTKPVVFAEQWLLHFTDDKIATMALMPDEAAVLSQLADPGLELSPDLISQYDSDADDSASLSTSTKKLSTKEMENLYREYLACINAHTMKTDLPRFVNQSVVHNANDLSLPAYCAAVQQVFTAVPDLVFVIDTIIADETTQRIAARIEIAGTPTGPLVGIEATGRSVRYYEHVTYSLKNGKIFGVWNIVDWTSYRRQLEEK